MRLFCGLSYFERQSSLLDGPPESFEGVLEKMVCKVQLDV